VTKGKDTSYPHLFEILKEKNNFEHFIKFLSSLAKNLGQAKTSIEQRCRIISAMYQYLSMGVVMRELAIHYEENTRQHLIQEFS